MVYVWCKINNRVYTRYQYPHSASMAPIPSDDDRSLSYIQARNFPFFMVAIIVVVLVMVDAFCVYGYITSPEAETRTITYANASFRPPSHLCITFFLDHDILYDTLCYPGYTNETAWPLPDIIWLPYVGREINVVRTEEGLRRVDGPSSATVGFMLGLIFSSIFIVYGLGWIAVGCYNLWVANPTADPIVLRLSRCIDTQMKTNGALRGKFTLKTDGFHDSSYCVTELATRRSDLVFLKQVEEEGDMSILNVWWRTRPVGELVWEEQENVFVGTEGSYVESSM